LIKDNIILEHAWMFDAMCDRDIGDLRVYGVKQLKWHRVLGREIQTANASPRNLREIARGLYEILHEECEMMSWDLEIDGVFFTDVPFHVIGSGNTSGLARYRNRTISLLT